ncbi:MAG: C25 family cysteine peptidase [Acidobacteriota bacterium]
MSLSNACPGNRRGGRYLAATLLLATLLLCLAWPADLEAQTVIRSFDNSTAGAIPFTSTVVDTNPPVDCPAGPNLSRTFVVADDFAIDGVALGLRIDHTSRDDLVVVLESPIGTRITVLNDTSFDPDDNYDLLLSPDAEVTDPDDGDGDNTGEPFYHRDIDVDDLDAFNGTPAMGTWTLYLCDDTIGTDGTFQSARLILQETGLQTAACSGTVTYDWASNGDDLPFTTTTFSDVTLTEVSTSDIFGNALASSDFETETGTQGGHTGYYNMGFDVTAAVAPDINSDESSGLSATFSFSPPVRDLTFDLLDVDFITGSDTANGGFEDLVRILAVDALGNRLAYQTQDADGGTDPDLIGDLWDGDVTAGTGSSANNPRYFIAGPVAQISVEYFQGNFPNQPGNQFIGISDFVLCAYDFGDAPASYSTSLGAGARHVLSFRQLYLGTTAPDGEGDGQPVAAGADNNGANGDGGDEEGVAAFPSSSTLGGTYTVPVTVTNETGNGANLCGWFDSGQDGTFEADEAVCVTVPASGSNSACSDLGSTFSCSLAFTVPVADRANSGDFYFRFRVTSDSLTTSEPTGSKSDGEVEDYRVAISSLPVTLTSFRSQRRDGQVHFEWQTESETTHVGFYLYDPDGRRLHQRLIPSRSLESFAPQSYVATLPASKVEAVYLSEVDRRGREAWYGPFEVGSNHGRPSLAREIDWTAVRRELQADESKERRAQATLAALQIDQDGLYRFTHDQLLAAGIDLTGIASGELALWSERQGDQAIAVSGGPIFGDGSTVTFYGEAIADSLHTDTNVYFFGPNPRRTRRIERARGTPTTRSETTYRGRQEVDRNLQYSFASPTGDPWFEARLLARGEAVSQRFEIDLDNLVPGEEGELELVIWGVTDWPGDAPDHHLLASFNGYPILDHRFDGLAEQRFRIPLEASWLRDGVNQLDITVPGDTGFDFDLIHVDRYRVDYQRRLAARQDRLQFSSRGASFEVTGFTRGDLEVYARTGRGLVELVGGELGSGFSGHQVRFRGLGEGDGEYLVASSHGLRQPRIRALPTEPPVLQDAAANYLIITHPLFVDHLAPLVAARRARGLTPKVVMVDDIYRAYSGAVIDPEAIRSYLRELPSLRFVLLVGGDTYDYRDHLGIGSVSFVPSPYRATDRIVRFAPVDPLLGDLDDDGIPEIPVGRWPVRTVAELDLVLAKTLAFPAARRHALLVSDDEASGRYGGSANDMAERLPRSWQHQLVNLDHQPLDDARSALLTAFDEGPGLIAFVGHSGPTSWTFDGLFRASDVDHLGNHGQPSLVAQWGCWNTYHVSPRYDTLGHRLLLAGPQGAAAVVGAATLTEGSLETLMGPDFLARLLAPEATVGETMIAVKRELAVQRPEQADILLGWTLLGDPALLLPRP